jgi:hypothetical protein
VWLDDAQPLNPYPYAANDPVMGIDPIGEGIYTIFGNGMETKRNGFNKNRLLPDLRLEFLPLTNGSFINTVTLGANTADPLPPTHWRWSCNLLLHLQQKVAWNRSRFAGGGCAGDPPRSRRWVMSRPV